MAATPATFAELLRTAVTEPGTISTAYSAFHNYSLGNQLLALGQCLARGIQPGPLATFQRWKELGRHVVKGREGADPLYAGDGEAHHRDRARATRSTASRGSSTSRTGSCWRRRMATRSRRQPRRPGTRPRRFTALDVEEVAFALLDGNVQGYAMRAEDQRVARCRPTLEDHLPRARARSARPHVRGPAQRRRAHTARSSRVRG